jgi:hypothetical protein
MFRFNIILLVSLLTISDLKKLHFVHTDVETTTSLEQPDSSARYNLPELSFYYLRTDLHEHVFMQHA